MPKEIQNPRTSGGLVDALGLKGRFPLQADEVCVATFPVLNIEQTPYAREARPCAGGLVQGAAGAGVFSWVAVRAQPGVILEVREIRVTCVANVDHIVNWIDGTAYQLLTTAVTQNMVYLGVEDPQVTPVVPYTPRVQSRVSSGTHNLVQPAATRLAIMRGPALTGDARLVLPYGAFLDGDAALGPPAIIVSTQVANNNAQASFFCREFTPKG